MLTKSNRIYEKYTKSTIKLIFCIKLFAKKLFNCLIREKVVTFRMVKLNLLLSIFLITK